MTGSNTEISREQFLGRCAGMTIAAALTASAVASSANEPETKIIPPEVGMYHGAFPNFGGSEDDVTKKAIDDFHEVSGKKMAWAYFSNNWLDGIKFPQRTCASYRR